MSAVAGLSFYLHSLAPLWLCPSVRHRVAGRERSRTPVDVQLVRHGGGGSGMEEMSTIGKAQPPHASGPQTLASGIFVVSWA